MKKLFHIPIPMLSTAMLLAILSAAPNAQAECPCSKGVQSYDSTPYSSGYSTPYPSNSMNSYHTGGPGYNQAPMMMNGASYHNNSGAREGITYYKTIREIPAKKPPRVGMVDVQVASPDMKVAVSDTDVFREEDLLEGHRTKRNPNHWIFESKPLLPGVPHIYRVEAQDASGTVQVKYVRLIPGRIVDVRF